MSSTLLSLLAALLAGQTSHTAGQSGHTGHTGQVNTQEAALADTLMAAPADARPGILDAARDAWTPELTRALYQRVIALRQTLRLDDAIAACELLAWVAERIDHPLGIAWAENSMGTVLDLRGDVLDALPRFEKAARIAEDEGDTSTLIAALNNAGKAYENLGDLAISQQRFRRMLSLAEQAGNARLIAHGLAALGQSLTRSDDYRQARIHLERARSPTNSATSAGRSSASKDCRSSTRRRVISTARSTWRSGCARWKVAVLAAVRRAQVLAALPVLLEPRVLPVGLGGRWHRFDEHGPRPRREGRLRGGDHARGAREAGERISRGDGSTRIRHEEVRRGLARAAPRARLLIVPDDSLWELPFHTLVDRRGRYVIDDAVVAYAPSLSTLREMTALARAVAPANRQPSSSSPLAIRRPPKGRACRMPRAK